MSEFIRILSALTVVFLVMVPINRYLGNAQSVLSHLAHVASISLLALFFVMRVATKGNASSNPESFIFSLKVRKYSIALIIFTTFVYIAVLLYDPMLFKDMSSDEKAVENLSAAFSFISFLIFIKTALSLRKNTFSHSKFYAPIAWFFAFLFFVITMEEIGWTRGIFHFSTPEFFKGNAQGEMNIHNYATGTFEYAYYYGTCLFFILLPFLNNEYKIFQKIPVLSFFIPSRFMVYVYAIAAAWNYSNLPDGSYPHFFFFLTIFILGYYAWIKKEDEHPGISNALIFTMIISQAIIIVYGHHVVRLSAFKEYKEFFIPLTFLFYSLEIYLKSKNAANIQMARLKKV